MQTSGTIAPYLCSQTKTKIAMILVYYHYNNGVSRRGSRCKRFTSRRDADRWIYFTGRKYPKFHLDEVFDLAER